MTTVMAIAKPHPDPEPDPIGAEVERILAEDPALLARLSDYDRRRAAGGLELIPHDEAMRRLGFDRRPE